MERTRADGALMLALWLTVCACASEAAAQEVGEVFQDCEECPQMVFVPGGRFIMGSAEAEEGRFDHEGPRRVVSIESFAVGVYEVTFEEWDACAWAGGCGGAIPEDEAWGRGDRPVINVSWEDAQAYVAWVSEVTGHEYRLLSEAEWEYVARAGTLSARYWGESEGEQCRYANAYDMTAHQELDGTDTLIELYPDDPASCSDGYVYTASVGSFQPNGFGLHDVVGNVWEWTQDCWIEDYSDAPNDRSARESAPEECSSRVLRGGSWIDSPRFLRSAMRSAPIPGWERSLVRGFRVARSVR